jgi:hypothetical protein
MVYITKHLNELNLGECGVQRKRGQSEKNLISSSHMLISKTTFDTARRNTQRIVGEIGRLSGHVSCT